LSFLAGLGLLLCPGALAGAEQPMGGVGLALGVDTNTGAIRIMRVIPNAPAAKAGVVAGTLLHKVGDTLLRGKSPTDCVALIRGPIGSALPIEVVDPKKHTTNRFVLKRALIDSAATLARLGDPAAPLVIKEWMQGTPVDVRDGKAIYVVEFWATWCGPCRVTIPYLSSLQKQLKDKGVVVIGISNEDPATVRPFVTKMGAQMEYTVACDEDYQTTSGYMEAYGVNTIPMAFIVGKDGRVLWHGNPMNGLNKALQTILESKEKLSLNESNP
jgi:thiol-disulfide isomerase/thioredoxin